GPWAHDDEPIVCFGADAPYQDLDPMDPEVVLTEDGPVMFMGNFEGIHAVPMTADGTALRGDPELLAGPGVEAPGDCQPGGPDAPVHQRRTVVCRRGLAVPRTRGPRRRPHGALRGQHGAAPSRGGVRRCGATR